MHNSFIVKKIIIEDYDISPRKVNVVYNAINDLENNNVVNSKRVALCKPDKSVMDI